MALAAAAGGAFIGPVVELPHALLARETEYSAKEQQAYQCEGAAPHPAEDQPAAEQSETREEDGFLGVFSEAGGGQGGDEKGVAEVEINHRLAQAEPTIARAVEG